MIDNLRNGLERQLHADLMEVIREMSACRLEMSAGIDYDYNQDLLDDLAIKRDQIKLQLDSTIAFREFLENEEGTL